MLRLYSEYGAIILVTVEVQVPHCGSSFYVTPQAPKPNLESYLEAHCTFYMLVAGHITYGCDLPEWCYIGYPSPK